MSMGLSLGLSLFGAEGLAPLHPATRRVSTTIRYCAYGPISSNNQGMRRSTAQIRCWTAPISSVLLG